MSKPKDKNLFDKLRDDYFRNSPTLMGDYLKDAQYGYVDSRGYDPYKLVDSIVRDLNKYTYHRGIGDYGNRHPSSISEALLTVLMNDRVAFEFFSRPDVIEELIRLCAKHRPSRFDVSSNTKDIKENEISDEDYETAIEVVDEYLERGLENLDDGELEIYQENKELIEKYESN